MRKHFLLLLLAIVAGTSSIFAATYNNIKIGDLYYNLNDSYWTGSEYIKRAVVTSNPNKYSGKVVVPDTVEYNDQKYAVKEINGGAFQDCSNLTQVIISEGVERINNSYAFRNCSSLASVSIPSTMNFIGNYAFNSCNSLQAVHISDLKAWCNISFYEAYSNPLNYAHHLYLNGEEATDLVIPEGVTELKQFAFYNCTGIKSIRFPEGFTTIGYSALDQTGLISIDIPEGVTNIEQYAFSSCKSLESVTLPESVTVIANNAFQYCSKLTSIVLPNSIKTISNSLFRNCTNLTLVTIPNSVTGIESNAFQSCTSLSSIVLPESVTSIGSQAFYNSGLTSIELPNSLENIANDVFLNCSQLTSVTIGTNVANIHSTAFSGCSKLNTIVWNVTDFADFGNPNLSPFYNYRTNITSFTFGENITHIPAYLCYEMNNLQKIDIPASVTSVGEGAFAYCGRLSEINAAAGSPLYTSIDGVLFNKDKTSLIIYPAGKAAASYAVPNTVTRIEDNAFYGCTNLSSIEIPASVTEIGKGNNIIPMWSFAGSSPASIAEENAFASDVYLIVDDVATYKAAWPEYESRIFPRQYAEQNLNLTAKTDKSALHMAVGDANLENVIKLTISGTINSYDLMIMRNKMINLRELDLTEASIEASPYEYYTGFCSHADTLLNHSFRGLRSIKLPKTLKYAEQALLDCPDLKYAEFNGGVIGTQVAPYKGDGDLKVVLNEGVTEIKPYAFAVSGTLHRYYSNANDQVNTKLRSIALPNSLGKVEAKRFWYCHNLQEVMLGNALTKIEDYAFCECSALTSIALPEALDTIGDFAFQGANIADVTIPSAVRRIGNGAFLSAFIGSNTYSNSSDDLADDLCLSTYDGSMLYHYYNKVLKGRYLFMGDYYNRSYPSTTASLRKITFAPDSKMNEIGVCAFAFCQLDEVEIPDSVATIGKYAFARNRQLKSVKFGQNSAMRTIARGVFQNCDALEEVVLPAELVKIEELAFSCHEGKDALKEIGIPSKLNAIDRAAFYGRLGLEKISFPTSLQTIGDYAFQGCTGLDEIRVPSTLRHVGDYAFDDCSNVTKVYTYTVEPVSIDQNTFSCWHNADLYVPTTSYYTYFYNTQWSQFLSLKQFDEAYEYFYINNDYELGGDNGTIDGKPDADLNENSGLIVTGDSAQQVGIITIAGDENGAASIIACEENLVADSLVIRLITQKGIWSYFCFPFDLVLDQLHFAHQYVIREYDGEKRAQYGAGGWINLVGDMLQKGLGYIFQGAQTDTLQITIPNPKIGCQDYEQIIQAFNASDAVHANWNFIGNPFPSWYDLDFLFAGGYSSPVYIWDVLTQDYRVYKPGDDEYHLHPYEGFFTQNPSGESMRVTWPSDGRETKTQADNKHHGNHAPARKAARRARQESAQRKLINIHLGTDEYTDRTRIVFNDAASMDYELGKDAVVMDGGKAPLHIWSINNGKRLSINERPYSTGYVNLGYDVNEAGFYTLSASRMDTAVIIYDSELNQEVDLSLGDYVFYTEAGTNNTRFSISRIKAQEEQETAVENIADPEEIVSVYTVLGVKLLDNVRRADINLNSGIYVIENQQGARTELNIK